MDASLSPVPETFRNVQDVEAKIQSHPAFAALEDFGRSLESRPLSPDQQRIFFGTLRAFFKEIPSGILALTLSVTDDWEAYEEYEGTRKGAYIMYANVDEYGLHEMHKGIQETHHQLFRDLVQHLGLTTKDLDDPQFVLNAGRDMGSLTREYYRGSDVLAGLGFHWASEATSCREFQLFLKGFQAHSSHYKLAGDRDRVLEFFRVHTLVEPKHKANAITIVDLYQNRADDGSAALANVWRGAEAFLDGFQAMFEAINQKL